MRLHVFSLVATAAVVAACADSPTQPAAVRVPTVNAAVNPGGRSVVEFNGPVRKDFAGRVEALGGVVDFISENGGFAAVSGLTAQAAASLSKAAGVASVYDDVTLQLNDAVSVAETATDVSLTSVLNPAGAILFGRQWNMRAIGANTAWAAGNLGSANVTAAILDTGIDYDNFDMNGVVDLSRSTSFVPSDNTIINAFFPGRNPIDDLHLHGTNVAAQVSSNALVYAGVTSRTKLIGVKVVGATGSSSVGGFLAGLIWAADHGADVANLSLGVAGGIDKSGAGRLIGLTNQIFNYAHRKGMVIVVSAGNEAENLDNNGRSFAAYCEAPHVICVSALGPTSSANVSNGPWANVDAFAAYSNFGRKSITVSAPGGTGAGFVQSICAKHALFLVGTTPTFPCNVAPGSVALIGVAGTSQAAPHVTGVIAQMIAKYGKGKPAQIKQMLLNSLDDLGPPGADDFYGAGRVNVVKALSH